MIRINSASGDNYKYTSDFKTFWTIHLFCLQNDFVKTFFFQRIFALKPEVVKRFSWINLVEWNVMEV